MGWEILWPLILGFALSAVVQAVVSHQQMSRLLPDDRPRSIATALALGAASSSCSYAAVALARSIFRKGAHFTAAMAFEMASTNLVLELSIIMVALLGWQLTLAEFVGAPTDGRPAGRSLPDVSQPGPSRTSQEAGRQGHRRPHGRPRRNGHVRHRGRFALAADDLRPRFHRDQPLFRDGLGCSLDGYRRRAADRGRSRGLGAECVLAILLSDRAPGSRHACGDRSSARWWR